MSGAVELLENDAGWQRRAHAVLDERSRRHKARKIEMILGESTLDRCTDLLEVGTGSGVIAAYFGERIAPHGRVTAIDVRDQRVTDGPFQFHVVSGVAIPFEANGFDVVLTNHVIEHVGPPAAQLHHLREIHRVLRPGGVAYLAVPNRWQLYEGHFRLWFLSWLPPRLRDTYVRLAGRGRVYDCDPLSRRHLLDLVQQVQGFDVEDVTLRALRTTLLIERPGSLADRMVNGSRLHFWLRPLRPVLPTHILLLRKRAP